MNFEQSGNFSGRLTPGRHGFDDLFIFVRRRFSVACAERVGLLETRLREIDALAAAGKLTEAVIAAEGLSISPIGKIETDESENVARRL
jgi:hypothetical protein